ncbi:MAG: DHH family phosphoesterase [Lachnospiraceae bacterium]|nr:DHH family phosphoesterase [Lachnospiraceae bacterium]MDY5496581.1 DHH family phosphoesterase [Anaerobutyricum sp.]
MKQESNISKRIAMNLWLPIIVVVLILVAALSVMEVRPLLGYTIMAGDIIYLVVSVLWYEYMEKMLSREFLAAGFEQSQIQKMIFKDLPIPYVITDSTGMLLWYNKKFAKMAGEKISKKSITQIFSGLYKKVFPARGQEKEYNIIHEDRKYRVLCKNMEMKGFESGSGETQGDILQVFYFFDETQLLDYKEESRKKSLVAGLIYIDNYEEVLENMEEVRQSLLLALVERKIVKYMQGLDAIIKKFEKDKFLFVFEEQNLEKLMESKFSILDEVRMINIGNDMSITLSISVGVNGKNYIDTYESARMAMDLALGRGGDQAVVRDGDTISYYGGKTQKVEKSTRVKARVKAHALREIMLTRDKIFVMGHKIPDADCIGAALGIYRLAKTMGKSVYIVMDKDCPAIAPIVEGIFREKTEDEEEIFITNEQAMEWKNKNSMLVIVDVNLPSMTECPELIKAVHTVVVLDHHRQTNETIKNAVVSYVEPYASSTCEMVAEILQYIADKPKLKNIEADAMYSGMLVDTDNFVIKAGVRTFEAAAYLRRAGADVTRVRKMFREDMEHCQIRASIVSRAEIFMDEFAISTFDGENITGATIVGAKAANALLNVQGIRGSFVLTSLGNCVYISARSIDELNVQVIMEKFGGGGHLTMAAAQLKDSSLPQAVSQLKEVLNTMHEEGDI